MNDNSQLISSYSKVLFLLAFQQQKKKKYLPISRLLRILKKTDESISAIRQELFFFKSLLFSLSKLSNFLLNPTIKGVEKQKLLKDIFPGGSFIIRAFIRLLADNNHFSLFPKIIDEFEKFFQKKQQYSSLKIIISSSIKKESLIKLIKKLKIITNSQQLFINLSYEPKFFGGFIIQSEFFTFDLTILTRFKKLIF